MLFLRRLPENLILDSNNCEKRKPLPHIDHYGRGFGELGKISTTMRTYTHLNNTHIVYAKKQFEDMFLRKKLHKTGGGGFF